MGSLCDNLPISKVDCDRYTNLPGYLSSVLMWLLISIIILLICSTYCLVISQF